jgi:hypothetical protein
LTQAAVANVLQGGALLRRQFGALALGLGQRLGQGTAGFHLAQHFGGQLLYAMHVKTLKWQTARTVLSPYENGRYPPGGTGPCVRSDAHDTFSPRRAP